MAYNLLLKKMIDNAGLTYKELADKCKSQGKSIDPSYISKLVNKKISPPSDEITKALATACESDYDELIIEAYIEKSPETVINAFNNIKKMLINLTVSMSDNQNANVIKEIFENMSFAEILKSFQTTDNNLLSANANQSIGLSVKAADDGMNPIIPKDHSANIINQKVYSNGDIVAIAEKEDFIIFRKYYSLSKDKKILISQNPTFEPIIEDVSKLVILGKVLSVIIK